MKIITLALGLLILFVSLINKTGSVTTATILPPQSATQPIQPSITQPPLLKYLTGTDIDGHLALDKQGNLIIDQGLLDFIDYHLSTQGRLSENAIVLQLQKQITRHLEEPARTQALDFLLLYQKYGKDYAELAENRATWFQQGMTFEAIDDSLKARQQLRQDVFGMATANALWHKDEIYDQQVLNNIQHRQNNQQDLINRHGIPEEFQQANNLSQLSSLLQRHELDLKQSHAHSAEIYQLRSLTLGSDAADRLGILDNKNRLWKERIEEYLDEKKSIETDVGYSSHNKKGKIEILRDELFSHPEQKRLLAYELHPKLLEQY